MGDEELTALGVYLYETEVSAVNCYWFDIDGDILDPKYTEGTGESAKYIQSSMVWGGKYTYSTWWTDEPLQVQGINILPMTPASFYAARNKEYIVNNWKTAVRNEENYAGLSEKQTKRWNEIWSEYLAMSDPALAMEYFDDQCDPEAGESKAHAYHWIMAMDNVGTPELDITSNNPLACVFKKADDEMTYVAYNASDDEKTVTFSDGAELVVPPHSMATVGDSQISTKARYEVEHYLADGNGGYNLANTEKKSGKIGAEVKAIAKKYPGYKVNTSVEGTVASGTIAEDGTLVLKLYYDVAEIETTTSNIEDTTSGEDVTTKAPEDDTTKDSQDVTTPGVTTNNGSQDVTTSVKATSKKVTVKRATIKKVKKLPKKKIKLTFKKIKGIRGYQIKISKKKNFKKKYTITRVVKKNRKVYKIKVSAKKLKKAKKLYVKARAYKTVNKKKVYGRWSKRKVIKR